MVRARIPGRRRQAFPLVLLAALGAVTGAGGAEPGGARGPSLRLRSGDFRPLPGHQGRPAWDTAPAERLTPSGLRHLVAILRGPATPAERAALETAGAIVLGYLPDHGFRLRLLPDAEPAIRALPFVAWLGDLPGHRKVDPVLADGAGRQAALPRARIVLERDESADRAMAILRGADARLARTGAGGAIRIEADLTRGDAGQILSRLAALPEVEAIEPIRPIRFNNQDAVWVHQSFVGPSPQLAPIFGAGLFGCGQVVAVSDSGQDYNACYFQDTVLGPAPIVNCLSAPCPPSAPATTRRKDILYYNWSGTPAGDDDLCPGFFGASGHGTHTSGSVAGDRSPYADCAGFTTPARDGGDGEAPGAKLIIQEMGDGLEYLNALSGSVWNLADVAFQSGARIQSFSWGGSCHDGLGGCVPGCTVPYDSFARDADLAMWTYPDLLMTISSGNAGQFCPAPLSVGTPGNAKSPVTVGAVGHGPAAGIPSAFSSPGPVEDGRLKPTLAAQGEATVSAASDGSGSTANCSTCSLDGTSMAAPTAAGLAALVREYYTAGYYASGARDPGAGFVPSGALIKATLIDAAVPLSAGGGPDFDSGFGRIQLDRTLALAGSPFTLRVDDHRTGLVTGGLFTRAFDVAAGTPLRFTLAWSDYPAALNAAVARVNELKLEVIDPAGTIWFQTIDAASGLPVATGNAADPHDGLNVEERLSFDTPAPGRWVARVRGVSVPMGPQPFALVARGALSPCAAPADPAAPALTLPADHEVRVEWPSVPGAASYNVYRALGGCTATGWVAVATGVAANSFVDSGLSGGTAWSYRITASSDPSGYCESPAPACASIVPSGECVLAPVFGGAVSATSRNEADCAVMVSWAAGSPYCGTGLRYNVYRGTTSAFVPGPSNRIARCVTGTGYLDAVDLAPATDYWYVVRAEDLATGRGGPCQGGNEDLNVDRVRVRPTGPSALGTFLDDAGDSSGPAFVTAAPWSLSPSAGTGGSAGYTAMADDSTCADLVSPTLTLASPALGPQLAFSSRDDLPWDPIGLFGAEGSIGQVEIATGPSFTAWTRVPLDPDYPALVEFPFNNCGSTQEIDTYISGGDLSSVTYTASLANWGGGDVKIRFHLSGDLLYPGGSWSIDDVAVTQALVPGACATAAAGPPPIPDGWWVPGQPVQASLAGGDVALTWDAARCPATEVNVYWGSLGDFTVFTGGACGLPAAGSALVAPPGDAWMIVAATDGGATDGSHSRDASGAERAYAGAGAVCPAITRHVTTHGCP